MCLPLLTGARPIRQHLRMPLYWVLHAQGIPIRCNQMSAWHHLWYQERHTSRDTLSALLSRTAQESADRPAPGQNVKQAGALLPESTQWGGHSPRHGIYRCHNLALVAVSGHSAEQSCSQDGAETGGAS